MPQYAIHRSAISAALPGVSKLASAFAGGDGAYQAAQDKEALNQSRIAQLIGQQAVQDAQARSYGAKADQDAAETAIIQGRPGVFETTIAARSGSTVPQVKAAREYLSTGVMPEKDLQGPPTEQGITAGTAPMVDQASLGKIGALIGQLAPALLGNVKDNKADDLAKADQTYRTMGLGDQVLSGALKRNDVAGSQAAAEGKPLYKADSTGAVLDEYGGALDTANPMAGATINLRGAQAGQAKAAAADHYAGANEKNATAGLRKAQTGAVGQGGGKAPSGYQWTTDPNTGEQVLAAIPGGPAAKTAPLKQIPATETNRIVENTKAISNIDAALSAIKSATGIDVDPKTGEPVRANGVNPASPDALGLWNTLPDMLRQRSDPKGVPVRAQIAQIGGQKFHDLSGAAITASEAPRLQPFIPGVKDDAPTTVRKLMNLKREYQGVNDALNKSFSEDQGYRSSPLLKPASASSGFRYLGVEK
jgi:hypothetical protein